MFIANRHLDLGCGKFPRNPYKSKELFGIDIRSIESFSTQGDFVYKKANLITERIPFDDSHFSSLSAFDFLEHVPRLRIHEDGATSFPFINLMNEVYRVLEPNGRFYALTPFYPNSQAFQDPTHVNFISKRTHTYFVGPSPLARMYGFNGRFECIQARRVASQSAMEGLDGSLKQSLRHFRKLLKFQLTHLLWEFSAIKP